MKRFLGMGMVLMAVGLAFLAGCSSSGGGGGTKIYGTSNTSITASSGEQFIIQLTAVGAAAAYAVIVTLVISFIIDKTIGFRVEKEDEIIGLDQTQHSESAYN